jgi:hypothetical protein
MPDSELNSYELNIFVGGLGIGGAYELILKNLNSYNVYYNIYKYG